MFKKIRIWRENKRLARRDEFRLSQLDKIIEQIDQIAQLGKVKMLSPETIARADYLREANLMVPLLLDSGEEDCCFIESSGWFVRKEYDPLSLKIIPFLEEDARLGPIGKYYKEVVADASYGPLEHTIILNLDYKETERYRAISLLHEAGHAMAAWQENRAHKVSASERSYDDKMEEELKMWLHSAWLTQLLGGQDYCAALTSAANRIICNRLAGLNGLQLDPGGGKAFDFCFGKAPNQDIASGRDILFLVYAEFTAATCHLTPDLAHQHQIELIKFIHRGKHQRSQAVLDRIRKELSSRKGR